MDFELTARRLREAYASGQIPSLRETLSPTDGLSAYEIQAVNTRYWLAQGRRMVGHKVGLTSKAVQTQLGVNQPDFGVLFEDMQIPAGATLNMTKTLQPKAEAEVALVLDRDLLDVHATAEVVANAAAYACAAIEIVDSRIVDWKISFADTVADNGSSSFFVLGQQKMPLDNLDLYTCGMVLEKNGTPASFGAGAACLDHPLNAAAWLVRTLSSSGVGMKAGDVILTGALGPMLSLVSGDHLTAKVSGLGSVSFSCADQGRA